MPSRTLYRRAGFADTIRLLASLIVLGCSIAARTAENAFGKRGNRFANAISLRGAPARQSTLLGAVMAWQWSAPAFRGGMPGEPIWSLHWRRHSASRRSAAAVAEPARPHDAQRDRGGRARSPLPLMFRRSISARLVSDELGEPSIRRLGRALERLEVDVDHAEAAAVAFRPFEVVDERPDEIATQFYTGGECAARGGEVLAQIGDAIVVVHDAIRRERIVVASAVLRHIEVWIAVAV